MSSVRLPSRCEASEPAFQMGFKDTWGLLIVSDFHDAEFRISFVSSRDFQDVSPKTYRVDLLKSHVRVAPGRMMREVILPFRRELRRVRLADEVPVQELKHDSLDQVFLNLTPECLSLCFLQEPETPGAISLFNKFG